jgi:hypothetical protein
MKTFYVLLILLWFKTKLTVYQSINLTGVSSLRQRCTNVPRLCKSADSIT